MHPVITIFGRTKMITKIWYHWTNCHHVKNISQLWVCPHNPYYLCLQYCVMVRESIAKVFFHYSYAYSPTYFIYHFEINLDFKNMASSLTKRSLTKNFIVDLKLPWTEACRFLGTRKTDTLMTQLLCLKYLLSVRHKLKK